MKRAFLLVLLAVVTTAAWGAPRLVVDGQPLSGGRLCLHRAAVGDDPAAAFLGGAEVTCLDLSAEVVLPEGEWLAWADHPDGYVSDRPLRVRDGVIDQEDQDIAVVRAVTAGPATAPSADGRQVFWVPSTGVVIGQVAGTGEVMIPDRRVWPITIRRGHVDGVGDAIVPAHGEKPSVRNVRPAVAALLKFDDVWMRRYEQIRPAPPEIEIVFGRTHEPPREAVDRYEPGLSTLLLFPPMTDGEIRVGGAGWKQVSASIVEADGSLFVESPIIAIPTSRLTVRWISRDDLTLAEPSSLFECDGFGKAQERGELEGVKDVGPPTLVLLHCPKAQPRWSASRVASSGCEEVGVRSVAEQGNGGEVTFEGVEPGMHVVRLDNGRLPSLHRLAEVSSAETVVDVTLDYVKVFGKVTRDGEPVRVYLAWGFGREGSAVTNPADGEYTIVLASKPTTAAIPIEACDGTFSSIHIPDEAPQDNARYDIELPDNEIVVSVSDAGTGAPIEGAGVSLAAAQPGSEDSAHFAGEFGKTDEHGVFTLRDSPENRRLVVCATHEEYERKCEMSVSTKDRKSQTVDLPLDKAQLTRGRVEVVGEIAGGVLMIFALDGRISEFARLDGGGAFVLKKPHQAGELTAFVSKSHPLYVFRYQPPSGDLVIQLPPAPLRTISASLPETAAAEGGMLSISIGGMPVPFNAFARHASYRRAQAGLRRGQSTTVTDVLETGPIMVHFLPDAWLQTQPQSEADPMYWPGMASFPSFPVRAEETIVLQGF